MIDFSQIKDFLDNIFIELHRSKIDVSHYELDHICYRVETQEEYNKNKLQLDRMGEMVSENMIGGRPIATYILEKPIIYKNRKIFVIELPSPKYESYYKTGFEHVEFVILEDFETFLSKYTHVNFNTKALKKEINPDISINFGDISVKFHRNTLEYVIKFEQ